MEPKPLFIQWRFPLFVGLLLSALFLHFYIHTALVEVDIEVSQTTWFKIYWAEEGQLFSEKNMKRVRVHPGTEHYSFFLTDLRKIHTLRIDPHQYPGEVTLKKLVLRQKGFSPIRFETAGDFSLMHPIYDVFCAHFFPQGFVVESTGKDPQFSYLVNLEPGSSYLFQTLISIGSIFILVFCFFFLTKGIREEARFVPLLFAAILALVIVMASISGRNVHPDEYVHFGATQYYMSNWLPPAADDPAIRDTYSVYGVSRLNNHEVAYFFQGKFAQLLEPFNIPDYLKLRLFNVVLFGIILLYMFRYPQIRLLAVPFLISPQLWYVFSYCDSDAFALFITLFVSYQVALPTSMLNQWLSGEKPDFSGLKIIFFGFICALLFLLKKNYLFFTFFLFGYIIWRSIFQNSQLDIRAFYKKIALIVLVGILFSGLRVGLDAFVNDFQRSIKINQLREELAEPLYKPSTPLEKKHPHLYRKARGETLKEFILIQRWFAKTFRSAFGVYGYFTASAPDIYYTVVSWVGVCFLLYIGLFVLLRGGVGGWLLLLFCLCCAGGLIAASLWHSWTSDFQPQGRYLFPIIPMLSIIVYHIRPLLPSPGFRLFTLSMFALSIYSFVYVALFNIPKV